MRLRTSTCLAITASLVLAPLAAARVATSPGPSANGGGPLGTVEEALAWLEDAPAFLERAVADADGYAAWLAACAAAAPTCAERAAGEAIHQLQGAPETIEGVAEDLGRAARVPDRPPGLWVGHGSGTLAVEDQPWCGNVSLAFEFHETVEQVPGDAYAWRAYSFLGTPAYPCGVPLEVVPFGSSGGVFTGSPEEGFHRDTREGGTPGVDELCGAWTLDTGPLGPDTDVRWSFEYRCATPHDWTWLNATVDFARIR